jgi:hypothetical protein
MTAEEAIVDVFERRSKTALFVTEVQYGIAPQREPAEFAAALQHLVQTGEIIIVTKPAPDVHLNDADLRIVARMTPDTSEAVESAWRDFLREFLASHRCS